MKAQQLLQELPETTRKELQAFLTEKAHPQEIENGTTTRTLNTAKTSQFDQILMERERTLDPNDPNNTLQETAVVGLTKQEGGPDIPTFIGAWSPEGFTAELNADKTKKKDSVSQAEPEMA